MSAFKNIVARELAALHYEFQVYQMSALHFGEEWTKNHTHDDRLERLRAVMPSFDRVVPRPS